jgi:hypothetical protein
MLMGERVKINEIVFENVAYQNVLGIGIDNNLKWHLQIDYVCKNLTEKLRY